jgi:hypothetical protein
MNPKTFSLTDGNSKTRELRRTVLIYQDDKTISARLYYVDNSTKYGLLVQLGFKRYFEEYPRFIEELINAETISISDAETHLSIVSGLFIINVPLENIETSIAVGEVPMRFLMGTTLGTTQVSLPKELWINYISVDSKKKNDLFVGFFNSTWQTCNHDVLAITPIKTSSFYVTDGVISLNKRVLITSYGFI